MTLPMIHVCSFVWNRHHIIHITGCIAHVMKFFFFFFLLRDEISMPSHPVYLFVSGKLLFQVEIFL